MAQEAFKLEGADQVLNMLKALPPEVVSKNGGPVKLALKAGANVIAKQIAANLNVVTSNETSTGEQLSTGLILKSLQVIRKRDRGFSGGGEAYRIRFRRLKYERNGKTVTTLKTAQILEYGSSKQPAEPFIRPAFETKKNEAVKVTIDNLKQRLDKVAQKLLKQGAR
jgi:HK97 gp10 family phage protein